ncbi:MFS transporter [Tsukamurella asaccharolytica]|uniref:MFS transporter n=1 Tax=Tsukamurella asaccharolytica TaxID=2592067 RepID=A0A5C5RDV9_9ACTN|nr:MFS transporter [Tsukamurella asaccharolytica]
MIKPGSESRRAAWGFTGLVVCLYVINWSDKAVLGLVAPYLTDEGIITTTQLGLIGSAFYVPFLLGNWCAGLINRSMALRWSLAALAISWSFVMLPIVLSATFVVLLVTRMLLGLLEGPSAPLVHTAIYSWHPMEKRGLPSAVVTMSASVAKLFIAPALALMIGAFGWRSAFITLAVAGLVWVLVWLPTWKLGPYGGEAKKTAITVVDDEPTVPWIKVLTSGTFIGAWLASMPIYAVVASVLTFLPSYFNQALGFSKVEAGTMFGLPSVASIITLVGMTMFSDRLVQRGSSTRLLRIIVPTLGLVLCAVALLTLPYIDQRYLAVAWVSIGYGLGVTVLPLFNAALSDIVPPRQVAAMLGIFLGLQSIGGMYGPYLAGRIVESASSKVAGYPLAFQAFGAMCLVGALIALAIANPKRDKARLRGITD